MPSLLDEATATFNEILRMHKLNLELLETLSVTSEYLKDYAEKHNIPLPDNSTFYSLINKAEALTEELTSNQLQNERKYLNRRFLTAPFKKNKTDGDLTEPETPLTQLKIKALFRLF